MSKEVRNWKTLHQRLLDVCHLIGSLKFSVSHLKHDGLVAADFLLGVDNFRNNDQCHLNSKEADCLTRHITRDTMRIEPKRYFDETVAQINEFMELHPKYELLINIDVDRKVCKSFNIRI